MLRHTDVVQRSLSPIEQGLLFHYLHEGQGAYVDQMVCDLAGRLDVRLLEDAVRQLVELHDALRTSYLRTAGLEWTAVVRACSGPCATFVDLSAETNARAVVERRVAEDGAVGFDLSRQSSRCTLYRLNERLHVFAWTYHHVVADSWTLRVLQEQFCALYLGLADCTATPYTAYVDWIARQDRLADLTAWGAQLARVGQRRSEAMPAVGVRRNQTRLAVLLSPDTRRRVDDLRRQCKVTANVVLLAMWGILALEQQQASQCLVGCVVFGRGIPVRGIDKAAGVCANTVPIVIDGTRSVRELLADLQRDVIAAGARSYLALSDILAAAKLTPGDLHSVVNFTIDEPTVRNQHTAHLPFEITNVRYTQAASFDAYLDVEVLDGGIEITIHFDTARRYFDGEELRRKCERTVAHVAQHPGGTVREVLDALLADGTALDARFSF